MAAAGAPSVLRTGAATLAAPLGVACVEAGLDEEKVILAEIDLNLLPETRATRPILKDRRPDLSGEICEVPS